jgi:hypothetical protein
MSSNTPPNPYVPGTYNPAYWTTTTSTSGITQDQLNNALATKLSYPKAQGGETFPSGLTTTNTQLVNTITYYNNTTSVNYENTGNLTYGIPPIFTTLPTTNPGNSSTLYSLGVSLNIGGTYIVFASVAIRNSVAGTTGTYGFQYTFWGSQTSVQQFDWYPFPPSGNSGLNVVGTGANTGYDYAFFSGVINLPTSSFLYNTTGKSELYLGVYNGGATGNWIFSNSGNIVYIVRIA